MFNITDDQKSAVAHINAKSEGEPINAKLRVTLNFHPDRVFNGFNVLEALARDCVYKSQFETGTSNGGLTAHSGGDRWNWESRIFGTAYDNIQSSERPKYGALNYKKYEVGGSPRFGSAHFRLKRNLLVRTTFCYPDSTFEPEAFGTHEHMDLIDIALADNKDLLDNYIEAQVHGELRTDKDIEALVLDICYKGTEIEKIARMLKCPIEWHSGFVLELVEMKKYPEYRGSDYFEIADAIAKNKLLTPLEIGKAAASGKYSQQDLKKVWHYLARFGKKYE